MRKTASAEALPHITSPAAAMVVPRMVLFRIMLVPATGTGAPLLP